MKNKGFTYTVPSDKNALTPFFPEVTNFRYIEGFKSGRLKDTRGGGIYLNGMFFQTMPQFANRFRNMPFGVYAINSDLDLRGDVFEEINTHHVWFYGNSPAHIDGTAIVSMNIWNGSNLPGSGSLLKYKGKGTGFSDPITFLNCKRGIWAEGPCTAITEIYNSKMEGVARGIEIRNLPYSTVKVTNNEIQASEYGIMLRYVPKCNADISRNYIRIDNPNPNLTGVPYMGIWVNNAGQPAKVNIYENMLEMQRRGRRAIFIQDVLGTTSVPFADGVTLSDNGIRMAFSAAHNRTGIYGENCDYLKVVNHQTLDNKPGPATYPPGSTAITGMGWNTFPADVNFGQTAMHIENCRNSLIQCNTMDNTRVGMRFYNDCDNSEVGGNEFNQHSYGLYIGGASSRIGTQEGRGNNWNWAGSATTGYIWGAWNAGDPSLSEMRVNEPSTFPNPPMATAYPKVPTKNGGLSHFPSYNDDWFFNTNTPNYSCGNITPPIERLSENDYWVANDSLVSEIYPEETQWSAQKALFEALAQDTTIVPDTGAIRLFFEEKSQTNLADFQSIHQAQTRLYEWNTANGIQNNAIQIQNWIQMRFENDSLIANGGLDSLDIATLEMTNEGLRQQIQSLSNTNRLLTEAMLAQQTIAADSILINNAEITINEVYEQNEKTVNEIYLAAFAKPQNIAFISPLEVPTIPFISLDSAQTTQLEAIAWQCPYSGGEAVYIARSMLAVVYEPIEYDNDSLCAVVGMAWRQQQPESNSVGTTSFLKVYPNPTSGKVQFELSESVSKNTPLIIYDGLGRAVGSVAINTENNNYEWDTQPLSEGIYYYTLNNYRGKFFVSK